VRGTWWGEFFTEEPEGYIMEGSGNGHLSPYGLCWGTSRGLISRGLSETDKGGLWKQSISLSMRVLCGEPGGYPEGYEKAGSGIGYVFP